MYHVNYEGFDIGIDTGTPITDEYKPGTRLTKCFRLLRNIYNNKGILTITLVLHLRYGAQLCQMCKTYGT
jgi:hypothetical protein